MEVRQLSIFLNNEPGALQSVTAVLRQAGINMRALSIVDSTDFGLLRIVVDRVDDALASLAAAHYVVKVNPVIVVRVDDKVGGLNQLLTPLAQARVNLEYIYAFGSSGEAGTAIVILKFDDNAQAVNVLNEIQVKLLSEQDITHL